jgi:hypothetical protein
LNGESNVGVSPEGQIVEIFDSKQKLFFPPDKKCHVMLPFFITSTIRTILGQETL